MDWRMSPNFDKLSTYRERRKPLHLSPKMKQTDNRLDVDIVY